MTAFGTPKTKKDWDQLGPDGRQLIRAILVNSLPNPEGLDDDELFQCGKELLFAGAIEIVSDGEYVGIEVMPVN